MAELIITKENFQKEVMESDQPVLLDFWAAWCGPCKMLMPVIEELAGEDTGAKIGKVNVDEQQELAERYKIMTIPTLMVFQKGQVMKKVSGVQSKAAILEMIKG